MPLIPKETRLPVPGPHPTPATETDRARITEQLAAGQEQLAFIRRSVTLEQLYGRTQRTAVEVGVKPTS